jgi:hypothetical protein
VQSLFNRITGDGLLEDDSTSRLIAAMPIDYANQPAEALADCATRFAHLPLSEAPIYVTYEELLWEAMENSSQLNNTGS